MPLNPSIEKYLLESFLHDFNLWEGEINLEEAFK